VLSKFFEIPTNTPHLLSEWFIRLPGRLVVFLKHTDKYPPAKGERKRHENYQIDNKLWKYSEKTPTNPPLYPPPGGCGIAKMAKFDIG
jgi:hypothetical protein